MTITSPRELDAPTEESPSAVPPASPKGRGRRGRFGIQPKLLVMLLVTSILSAAIVGFVGYRSGTNSLRDSAFDQLTEIRESRAREIDLLFESIVDSMVIYTRGRTAIEAVEAFTAGFEDLQSAELTAAEEAALDSYFEDVFLPQLEDSPEMIIPIGEVRTDAAAAKYLQTHYTAPAAGDFDAAIAVDDAGDGSDWSAAHARFHDYFRELTVRFLYEDALLLDTEGNVVYSAYKGVELGTNVLDGPFADSDLGQVYEDALESNAVDFVGVTDFDRYVPSLGIPTAWVASPIGTGGEVSGVLALQLPIATINDIMTAAGGWVEQGLGQTGETYLAGPDFFMRSVSRLVLEDPDAYLEASIAAGGDPDYAARAAEVQGTILFQTVETEGVQRALRGETGTLVGEEYLGREALVAYEPVHFEQLPWVIVAKVDTSEAFAPTRDFARRLAISTGIIVLVVCLASLLLAQVFVRPVRRLVGGVRAVAEGDLGSRVDARSNDEFGDLGTAFNDMSRSLQTKQELLEGHQAEHERLLLSLMPANVADRYRRGEETIAQDHQDVAVVVADLVGYNEYAAGMPSDLALATLNAIVRSFDEAADRLGVERVRTLRSGYLATSGLTARGVDNVRLVIDFAEELDRIVARFNAEHGTGLGIRAGVDFGTVTSGLVGRSNVVCDLWGDAVNLAARVQTTADEAGIYVAGAVYELLRDARTFEPAGEVETANGPVPRWRLHRPRVDAAPGPHLGGNRSRPSSGRGSLRIPQLIPPR